MKCPIDGTALTITQKSGVEIDYCPQCRGVWLDRGELDKIIERSGSDFEVHDGHHAGRRHGKHRKSLLSDLFDF